MTTTAPAVGAWDDTTRGFWTGGHYVMAGELAPGDIFRWHTYAGYVVETVTIVGELAHVKCVGHDAPTPYHVTTILERMAPGSAAATYREHVSHDMLTYPTPENPGADAWEQLGPGMTDRTGTEFYGVRGMDGNAYVAEGSGGAWRIVRAGSYGLGAVVRSDSLKGAVQRLNAFHVGETCIHCGCVNPSREHWCSACGRRRYA